MENLKFHNKDFLTFEEIETLIIDVTGILGSLIDVKGQKEKEEVKKLKKCLNRQEYQRQYYLRKKEERKNQYYELKETRRQLRITTDKPTLEI